MRFTDSCRPAMRFATVIVSTARPARIGGHPAPHEAESGSPNAIKRTRSMVAKAALLTATAMNVVAGVGRPHVERHGAHFEDEPEEHEHEADDHEGQRRHAGRDALADTGEVGVTRR